MKRAWRARAARRHDIFLFILNTCPHETDMKNHHRSQGAPYVRNLRHSLLMWDVDETAKLLWSPRWAMFVSASGEERRIYGLSYEDAKAICRIYGIAFHDQTPKPR